jgi:hypothetical protein
MLVARNSSVAARKAVRRPSQSDSGPLQASGGNRVSYRDRITALASTWENHTRMLPPCKGTNKCQQALRSTLRSTWSVCLTVPYICSSGL